jgi:hypothetical protein
MEGQFNKIKKFKGVLLALMVAVAASIPVTTGEFKDAYAAKIIPQNQRYERYYGFWGSGEYFFVWKDRVLNVSPIILRYTVATNPANNETVCNFEVYTEVTSNSQRSGYWLWFESLKLEIQNSACTSEPGVVRWHPSDEAVREAYDKVSVRIRELNTLCSNTQRGLNFKAIPHPMDVSTHAQDGYIVNENFIASLQRNIHQPSDRNRLHKRVQPAVNRSQYQPNSASFNQNRGQSPHFNQSGPPA